MDPVAAKYIGAGIACIGMGGAGVGVGIIFGNYLAAALRNPSAAQGQFGNLIFGFLAVLYLFFMRVLRAVWVELREPKPAPLGSAPVDLQEVVTRFFIKGGSSADIGCGSGREVAWLNANGFPAVGFDASDKSRKRRLGDL